MVQIRNKRLAKLGSQAQVPSQSSTSEENNIRESPATAQDRSELQRKGSPEDREQTRNKISISKPPSSSEASPNPFSQLQSKTSSNGAPKINITPSGDGEESGVGLTPTKRERPGSAAGRSPSRESPEQWEDKMLRGVFRLSLQLENKQDSHGHRLHYVAGVREEIEEQGAPLRLTTGNLDQALLEAASGLGKETPLDYLLGCWKRVTRQYKALKPENPRHETVKEARRLCMSYCIFAVTMPDMFE